MASHYDKPPDDTPKKVLKPFVAVVPYHYMIFILAIC
jgi:hypothetical protein